MLGVRNHVRRQVNPDCLVPLGRQKTGKETCACADVQYAKDSVFWKIPAKLREPSLPFLAVVFTQALGLEGFGPVRPVVGDAMFDQFHILPLCYHSVLPQTQKEFMIIKCC